MERAAEQAYSNRTKEIGKKLDFGDAFAIGTKEGSFILYAHDSADGLIHEIQFETRNSHPREDIAFYRVRMTDGGRLKFRKIKLTDVKDEKERKEMQERIQNYFGLDAVAKMQKSS